MRHDVQPDNCRLYCGDCRQVIPTLPDGLFHSGITSPPYAEQRADQYDSIPVKDYPEFTVAWMETLRPKLTDDGSVLIVIRAHVWKGNVSDYVYRTILAVRDAGWFQPDELIWCKSDAPPLGSRYNPRRTWEHILWFAKSKRPFIDLWACGNHDSTRTGGFITRNKHGNLHSWQNPDVQPGTSRVTDIFSAHVAGMNRSARHPAMFPPLLSDLLVQTFSAPGDWIIDPFAGSGTTLRSAMKYGRRCVGIDSKPEYVREAERLVRLAGHDCSPWCEHDTTGSSIHGTPQTRWQVDSRASGRNSMFHILRSH